MALRWHGVNLCNQAHCSRPGHDVKRPVIVEEEIKLKEEIKMTIVKTEFCEFSEEEVLKQWLKKLPRSKSDPEKYVLSFAWLLGFTVAFAENYGSDFDRIIAHEINDLIHSIPA